MVYLGLFFAEIFILFFLSRTVSKTFSGFMSITWMSILYLPGVVVHELAHLLMATVLFVPVGEMEFIPKKHGSEVKLGSVEIGKTDPIRRSLIGFAPVLIGLLLVVGLVYLFSSNILFFQNKGAYLFAAVVLILIYLLFAISNTMFSSSKDMEGAVEIAITLLIIFIVVYILGFRIPLSLLERIFTKEFFALMQKSTLYLLSPIVIDVLLLGVIRVFTYTRSRSRHFRYSQLQ